MLSTKENLKQIEMDTIQQEPLFTELTPEAAATVEGGIKFRADIDSGRLNIRSGPSTNSRKIGSFGKDETFDATSTVRGRWRRLTEDEALEETGERVAWVNRDFIAFV
ncbi:MAG: SH3 domain-containing protein [Nostoc sp.]|uniref:SH3 domain-containing protein n=1 Tax=Nostoc sp. TaxID=1180 RepID=UPI002FF6611D